MTILLSPCTSSLSCQHSLPTLTIHSPTNPTYNLLQHSTTGTNDFTDIKSVLDVNYVLTVLVVWSSDMNDLYFAMHHTDVAGQHRPQSSNFHSSHHPKERHRLIQPTAVNQTPCRHFTTLIILILTSPLTNLPLPYPTQPHPPTEARHQNSLFTEHTHIHPHMINNPSPHSPL